MRTRRPPTCSAGHWGGELRGLCIRRGLGEHEEQRFQRGLVETQPAEGNAGLDDVDDQGVDGLVRSPYGEAVVGAGDLQSAGADECLGGGVVGGGDAVSLGGCLFAQAGDRSVVGDRSAAHDGDVVADLLDFAHVMAAQQYGQAAGGKAFDQGPHVADAGRVEPVGGLVEDEELRVANEGCGDTETLSHAEGVSAHLVSLAVGEVHDVEDFLDPAGCRTTVESGEEFQVPSAAEPGIELRTLDKAGHALKHCDTMPVPRATEDFQGAAIGANQSEQHPQKRRFPRAVRAEKTVDLALGDLDGDPVHRSQRAKGLGQFGGIDRQHFVHAAAP